MDAENNTYNDLLRSIEHWNEYRVPILKISKPDRNLIFHGAMRFYFQDAGQKVSTKCVDVTSSDTTKNVIDVLIEKFRPDMRMLSVPEYGLYEIHENGDERKLQPDERPLYVQLEWNKDDREGRFLLRRMDEKTKDLTSQHEEPSLKRKLSKKEKKKQEKQKKQQIKEQEKADAAATKLAAKNNKNGIAERLYNELPETSFTRSISNPEAVMKRRRAQKLERRLQEFSLEGGQEAGGTLRIFGETINKDVSYKTLLLSTKDTASSVVKQILEKYGKDGEDPFNYCLVQLVVPNSANSADTNSMHDFNTGNMELRESILEDTDCPLLINQNHDKSKGVLTFHIRHKPADYQKRRKKKPPRSQGQQNSLHPTVVQQLNQRLQVNNNNSEQYSNQNSPHNSSQTSGSLNHDSINPPPPPFETVHSMPTMFPSVHSNGNMMPYQQHSVSAATLPPPSSRVANHQNQLNSLHDVNGTLPYHQPYNQPNNHSKQFTKNPMVQSNHFPMSQQHQPPPPPPPQQQHHHQPQQHPIPQQQQYTPVTGANDHILPALIQVKEDVEDLFLSRVITHLKPSDVTFKLAPTYVLYMVSRYRASTLFHPELQAPSRAELFVPFTRKIATMVRNTIEVNMKDPAQLAFWLANSSDLSHFYKQDKHLSHFTIEAQRILYDSIKASFKYLLACKQLELDAVMLTFFDDRDDQEIQTNFTTNAQGLGSMANSSIYEVLRVLNDTMSIMRKNRVNTALTIQTFAHLFHHISKWLFDRLIGVYDCSPNSNIMNGQPNFSIYCTRIWGERLNKRLAMIVNWAEKQGLEQAADFHLARVTQVTLLLSRYYPPGIKPNEFEESLKSYDRLNVVQLRALLQRYQPQQPGMRAIIEYVLYTMDYSYMAGEFPLEEDFELKIPFLIPDDGYTSEMIRYIPNGLLDFVSYLSKIRVKNQELCIFTVQPSSSGFWTVYFKNHQPDSPDIVVIQLRKKNNSMGLSIIAARGVGQDRLGIYIKNVVKNGAAAQDGRLQAGDQLLEVDGNSLIDISQETAAELMQRTGSTVTLKIAKQAAIYHNLSDIINSVPSQTIVSNSSAVMHPMIPPPPLDSNSHPPMDQIPMHLPMPPQMVARHSVVDQHTSQQHLDPRMMQFLDRQQQLMQAPNPQHYQHQVQPERLTSNHQHQQAPLIVPERQVHFQPTPSSVHYNDDQHAQSMPISTNPTSPLKSPKKVSWVDTQPHQSLHTLIPPSPALVPSPGQPSTPPNEVQPSHADDGYPTDNFSDRASMARYSDDTDPSHTSLTQIRAGNNDNISSADEDEDSLDEDSGDQNTNNQNQHMVMTNGRSATDQTGVVHRDPATVTNGQLDTTTESLTLEDIDEVLSSKTDNNWIEDSAGVIGTQEVYNDPRQRIVKERERPSEADVNIEKLSFQEKLKMFNISAKK